MVCSSTVNSMCAAASFNDSLAERRECVVADSLGNGSFNVEASIASMLADPKCSSLALPGIMTAEQRKQAKMHVGQYPELKCESFGMGADRRMHVFKCSAGEGATNGAMTPDCSPHSVNVKNTFIDDWIDADVAPADNRIVQSMPHNMFGKCLSAELAGLAMVREEEKINVTSSSIVSKDSSPHMSPRSSPRSSPRWAEELVMEEQIFDLGTTVMIEGLVKAPSFNGAVGVVQSWDAETGRYNVLLARATTTGHRWAKLKAENLQLPR